LPRHLAIPRSTVGTWAADWFTIVTVRFEILYAFVILDLRRREILRLG